MPAGSRLLITAVGAKAYGADLTESVLVTIAADGSFEHRTLLSYPLAYALSAEFSQAANPEMNSVFIDRFESVGPSPATVVQKQSNGTYKIVAEAGFRLGDQQQEKELLAAHLEALEERIQRLEYDRKQIEKITGHKSREEAVAGYLAWSRIRLDKMRELEMDTPAIDPFFSRLDLQTRALWTHLDRVGLFYLAGASANAQEEGRLEKAIPRFDGQMKKAGETLARLKGNAK